MFKKKPSDAFVSIATSGVRDGISSLELSGNWSKQRSVYAQGRIAKYTGRIAEWLEKSVEASNFTYELRAVNRQHLAAFVATVANIPIKSAMGFIEELQQDNCVLNHYSQALAISQTKADPIPLWGRRLGWYALTRALKPKLIVETGVHNGLGALAFTAALKQNATEDHHGRYIGLEVLPHFGWLLSGPYEEFGEIRYGKSLDLLSNIEGPIELFLHDSDHSVDHETSEFRAVEPKLSKNCIVMSDNTYTSPALYEFANETDRRFLHFQEISENHFYPGAGFAAAWFG
ncbi:class I SAM-dependent methyltransferase [Roseibium sp. MMSF_3544]|uniref:class I SAM-dependent methyltransferase n=1 Tax=unclassified Roseibium TaxID=2629323 RepID=UPI00273EE0C0|nr:class I SAM-dependent methyltransferase [Roseibium sp. MMSF_3544]